MAISSYKEIVGHYLTKYPPLRDRENRQRLVNNVWNSYLMSMQINPTFYSTEAFFKQLREGKIPSADSITRCARRLQQLHPHLQSKDNKKKKKELEDKVVKDLKENFD